MENTIDKNIIMSIVPMILSCIAIIVSIGSCIYTNYNSRKIAKGNNDLTNKLDSRSKISSMNKRFFEEILFVEVTKNLPEALARVEDAGSECQEKCEDMRKVIIEITNKVRFYKYFDNNFYDKVCPVLINIEEILVKATEPSISASAIDSYKKDITTNTNTLYAEFKNYYIAQ